MIPYIYSIYIYIYGVLLQEKILAHQTPDGDNIVFEMQALQGRMLKPKNKHPNGPSCSTSRCDESHVVPGRTSPGYCPAVAPGLPPSILTPIGYNQIRSKQDSRLVSRFWFRQLPKFMAITDRTGVYVSLALSFPLGPLYNRICSQQVNQQR